MMANAFASVTPLRNPALIFAVALRSRGPRAGTNVDGVDDDLLAGLEGAARAERAELIAWQLEQGITADEIRATNPPLLLATRHLVGDDGTYVSTREISERYGVELELLQRVQRAIGLVRWTTPTRSSTCVPTAKPPRTRNASLNSGLTPTKW